MPDALHETVASRLATLQPAEDGLVSEIRSRADSDGVPAADAGTTALLRALVQVLGARRVFEIGTGYGLSTLAVALEAGPESLVFTVERDRARAAVARECFERAGVGDRVNVMLGEAARLVHKVAGPFDLVVLDADLGLRDLLHDRLVGLLRPGGVLASPGPTGPDERLARDGRLSTAVLPVGNGVTISVRGGGQR